MTIKEEVRNVLGSVQMKINCVLQGIAAELDNPENDAWGDKSNSEEDHSEPGGGFPKYKEASQKQPQPWLPEPLVDYLTPPPSGVVGGQGGVRGYPSPIVPVHISQGGQGIPWIPGPDRQFPPENDAWRDESNSEEDRSQPGSGFSKYKEAPQKVKGGQHLGSSKTKHWAGQYTQQDVEILPEAKEDKCTYSKKKIRGRTRIAQEAELLPGFDLQETTHETYNPSVWQREIPDTYWKDHAKEVKGTFSKKKIRGRTRIAEPDDFVNWGDLPDTTHETYNPKVWQSKIPDIYRKDLADLQAYNPSAKEVKGTSKKKIRERLRIAQPEDFVNWADLPDTTHETYNPSVWEGEIPYRINIADLQAYNPSAKEVKGTNSKKKIRERARIAQPPVIEPLIIPTRDPFSWNPSPIVPRPARPRHAKRSGLSNFQEVGVKGSGHEVVGGQGGVPGYPIQQVHISQGGQGIPWIPGSDQQVPIVGGQGGVPGYPSPIVPVPISQGGQGIPWISGQDQQVPVVGGQGGVPVYPTPQDVGGQGGVPVYPTPQVVGGQGGVPVYPTPQIGGQGGIPVYPHQHIGGQGGVPGYPSQQIPDKGSRGVPLYTQGGDSSWVHGQGGQVPWYAPQDGERTPFYSPEQGIQQQTILNVTGGHGSPGYPYKQGIQKQTILNAQEPGSPGLGAFGPGRFRGSRGRRLLSAQEAGSPSLGAFGPGRFRGKRFLSSQTGNMYAQAGSFSNVLNLGVKGGGVQWGGGQGGVPVYPPPQVGGQGGVPVYPPPQVGGQGGVPVYPPPEVGGQGGIPVYPPPKVGGQSGIPVYQYPLVGGQGGIPVYPPPEVGNQGSGGIPWITPQVEGQTGPKIPLYVPTDGITIREGPAGTFANTATYDAAGLSNFEEGPPPPNMLEQRRPRKMSNYQRPRSHKITDDSSGSGSGSKGESDEDQEQTSPARPQPRPQKPQQEQPWKAIHACLFGQTKPHHHHHYYPHHHRNPHGQCRSLSAGRATSPCRSSPVNFAKSEHSALGAMYMPKRRTGEVNHPEPSQTGDMYAQGGGFSNFQEVGVKGGGVQWVAQSRPEPKVGGGILPYPQPDIGGESFLWNYQKSRPEPKVGGGIPPYPQPMEKKVAELGTRVARIEQLVLGSPSRQGPGNLQTPSLSELAEEVKVKFTESINKIKSGIQRLQEIMDRWGQSRPNSPQFYGGVGQPWS